MLQGAKHTLRLGVRHFSKGLSKRPTTPLGMLAWDAREEAERNLEQGFETHELVESAIERMATRKIREDMESGGFDGLKGAGKSISHYNLGTDNGLNLVLKNANVLPKFIKQGKEIRKALEQFRATDIGERDVDTLNDLNKQIRSYNLICKIPTAFIPLLDREKELITSSC